MMRHGAPFPRLTQTRDRLFDAYWYGDPAARYLAIELADPRGIGGDEWRISVWRYGNRSSEPDAVEWAGTRAEAKHAGFRLLDDVNEERRNPRLSVSGWRIVEQTPRGEWRHALDAPGFFKTEEEARVAEDRLRQRFERMGHRHPLSVEWIGDVGAPPSWEESPSLDPGWISACGDPECVGCPEDERSNPPWDERERTFEEIVSDAADAAFRVLMHHPYAVYLYMIRSTEGEYGQLVPVRDDDEPPAGAELAINQRLPSNVDRAGLRAFIHERARRLPLLPWGDQETCSTPREAPCAAPCAPFRSAAVA